MTHNNKPNCGLIKFIMFAKIKPTKNVDTTLILKFTLDMNCLCIIKPTPFVKTKKRVVFGVDLPALV